MSSDPDRPGNGLRRLSPIQVINSLFPFLYHGKVKIKRRAIGEMASMVARLADKDVEAARNVVRRLMWNLNDESGGIGWGSPEAMGEILAQNEALAREYTHILISYSRPEANYLENEILQRGLLWAIARLEEKRPGSLAGTGLVIQPYLESEDAGVRGLAAELAGRSGDSGLCGALAVLLGDESEYDSPMEEPRRPRSRVKQAAREAIERLECR